MRHTAAAFLALIVAPGTALASTISFSDAFSPGNVFMSNQHPGGQVCVGTHGVIDTTNATGAGCGSLTWTHQLAGYNPVSDVLTAATLTLHLYDDGDSPHQAFNLTVDLFQLLQDQVVTNGTSSLSPFVLSLSVLGQLHDGFANVLLDTAKNGNHDFWFMSSTLDAQWQTPSATAVPEPASLVLFASGLSALVAATRRRRGRLRTNRQARDAFEARP